MKLIVKYLKFYNNNKFHIIAFIISGIIIYSCSSSPSKKHDIHGENYEYTYDSIMSILNNKDIPLDEKYELTYHVNNLPYDQVSAILLNVIEQGKGNLDDNKMLNLYSTAALMNLILSDPGKATQMLTYASEHAKKAKDPEALGIYHYSFGNYFLQRANEREAHEHFFDAMPYYEESEKLKEEIIPLYFSMAHSYAQRRDSANLKKIIDKMIPIAVKQNKPNDLINTYTIISHYYSYLFEKDETQKIFLDSAIIYDAKAIDVFNKMKNPPPPYREHIGKNYINLAENEMKLQDWNSDSISSYLSKAKEYINPADTASLINYHWVRGNLYFKLKQINEAKDEFNIQRSLLNNMVITKDYSVYARLYGMLAIIYGSEENYKDAFKYSQLQSEYKDKLHDKDSYAIIQNLQAKYDDEKKEQVIKQLRDEKKIIFLIVGICIFGLIAAIVMINMLRLKKRSVSDQLQIAYMKQEEAELKDRLKEEQLERMELEKYEALLESRFKDMAIEGKEDELNQLKKQKASLDKQLAEYAEKLEKYEEIFNKEQAKKESAYKKTKSVVNTLIDQIDLELELEGERVRSVYIDRINALGEKFLGFLCEEYKTGNLAPIYISYCICFAIDMDRNSISKCLNVETKSIRQARTRIKGKLKLEKEEDLDDFLKSKLENAGEQREQVDAV